MVVFGYGNRFNIGLFAGFSYAAPQRRTPARTGPAAAGFYHLSMDYTKAAPPPEFSEEERV
jgi:hypothetical protein